MTEREFWQGTFGTLRAYAEADNEKQKRKDRENWMLGKYIEISVSVAIEHCFSKNPKSEYIKNPFCEVEEPREKTEEEINAEIQRAIFLEDQWSAQLQAKGMQKTIIKE